MNSNEQRPSIVSEVELVLRASCGDKKAWTELIKIYSGRVNKIVKKNLNKYSLLDEDDIRSACYEGLVRAVQHYRPDSKASFNTYASYWFDCMIKQEKANVSSYHVPQKKRKFFKVIKELKQSNERITVDKIQKTTGLDKDEVIGLLNAMDYVVDLDDSKNDKEYEHVEDTVIQEDELSRLKDFLDSMDERQAYILKSIFGAFGCEKKSQTEIGKELGISKQRVDQIKKEGFKKCLEFMCGQ
ncbi:MAG: sigma-70 family RNA polymerase sigma factor [Sphaerochaetaceae bacterium]|nr:sigma-70 family RNA polymerase sigma factor [Sphaerochaetaceae bacterium]